MSLLDRLSNGWSMSMQSLRILNANKKLIIFPILSGASLILLITSFLVGTVFASSWLSELFENDSRILAYLLVFCFYLVNFFIVIFFNVALMFCVGKYFKGEEVDISEGLNFSFSRIGIIFSWAVMAATVGTILKMVQEEFGIVGKIITGIIGIVWNIATFFVVPVLVNENLGPVDAIKRSAGIMKEKWGESLVGNFSLGLVQFVALLLICVPLFFLGSLINTMVGVVLALEAGLLVIAVISAAQSIFICGVYHRTQGVEIPMINDDKVDMLFGESNKKKFW